MEKVWGAVEGGGTKFVCLVGKGPEEVLQQERFETTTPQETLGRVVNFFKQNAIHKSLEGIGVGCFGPLDLNPASPTYGCITATPKPGWAGTPVLTILRNELQSPVVIDTDVNAAAWGEYYWGAGQNFDPLVYITIGTGIGAGGVVQGKLMHGLIHPEMGHIFLPHDQKADPFEGGCPFHKDCFEGLASGPAMKKRWGKAAEELQDDHPAWKLEAHYIATALMNLVYVLSPKRIILGGGVMQRASLLPLIWELIPQINQGYMVNPILESNVKDYIVSPGLGNQAGVLGALALSIIK